MGLNLRFGVQWNSYVELSKGAHAQQIFSDTGAKVTDLELETWIAALPR